MYEKQGKSKSFLKKNMLLKLFTKVMVFMAKESFLIIKKKIKKKN